MMFIDSVSLVQAGCHTKRIEGTLLTNPDEWKFRFLTVSPLRLCWTEVVHYESQRLSLLVEAASYL